MRHSWLLSKKLLSAVCAGTFNYLLRREGRREKNGNKAIRRKKIIWGEVCASETMEGYRQIPTIHTPHAVTKQRWWGFFTDLTAYAYASAGNKKRVSQMP